LDKSAAPLPTQSRQRGCGNLEQKIENFMTRNVFISLMICIEFLPVLRSDASRL